MDFTLPEKWHPYNMTTNPRDLIKRLADELDRYQQILMPQHKIHSLINEARAYLDQPEPDTKARELLNLLLDDLDALIDNSEGVANLHLNGDIACWESLRQGGSFETWLMRMDEARAFLDSTMDKPAAARPAIEPTLTVEDCCNMHKHSANFLVEDRPGTIVLDGCFTREDLIEIANTVPTTEV
jgi:hypothetical protein